MSRKEITRNLNAAASSYYVRKVFAVFPEFGVGRRGQYRLDLLCMNNKRQFIGIESKSCAADYRADTKWKEYLPYTNKLYFLIPETLYESKFYERIVADTKPYGVGIMTCIGRKVTVVQNAKTRSIEEQTMLTMLTKMAWRNGINRANK